MSCFEHGLMLVGEVRMCEFAGEQQTCSLCFCRRALTEQQWLRMVGFIGGRLKKNYPSDEQFSPRRPSMKPTPLCCCPPASVKALRQTIMAWPPCNCHTA